MTTNITLHNSPISINHYSTGSGKKQDQSIDFFEAMQTAHKEAKKAYCRFLNEIQDASRLQRVQTCGNFIVFERYPQIDEQRLKSINLCRERLCLNCQLAKSRNTARELIYAVQHLHLQEGETLHFLTLTVKSVPGTDLRAACQNMSKASKAFLRQYGIKDYYRSTEITVNQKTGKYHPHLHFLIIAPPRSGFPLYTGRESVKKLRRAWAETAKKSGFLPEIDKKTGSEYLLAMCKPARSIKAVFELSKYVTKPQDITETVISHFYGNCKSGTDKTGIAGLRLKTPCGRFKTAAREYDLVSTIQKDIDEMAYRELEKELIFYLYDGRNYIEKERRKG